MGDDNKTNEAPPTDHILRPHHIDLLSVLSLTFKDFQAKGVALSSSFTLYLYRLLLIEISEVSAPKSRQQLLSVLNATPCIDEPNSQLFINAFKDAPLKLRTSESMSDFFASLPAVFVEKTDDDPPIVMRRSLFGYFCRRCFVSFMKLSFSGIAKLVSDYQTWCSGRLAGYETIMKDQLDSSDIFIWKVRGDHTAWAQTDAFEMFEKEQATGDESHATENLRRFFEQHFHEGHDSGLRQHALLHLVRVHYIREEYTAARQVLDEAITTARVSGDKQTLQHCISMLNRFPAERSTVRPALNEIQPDLHPLEVLFDVKKLIDEQNEQPLSAAFVRISQAVGLYDHWVDSKLEPVLETEQWAQHAAQDAVWSTAGCERLAAIEESIVLAFTEGGSDDQNRIVVTMNQAHKRARQGDYETGLSMLLDPQTWRGLKIPDYMTWAREVWHILALRACRRGQQRLYREFLLPRRPPGYFNPRQYAINAALYPQSPSTVKIEDPLFEVIQMREHDQAPNSVDRLLTALWHSEFLGRLNFYRTGLILLADVGLEFGMSDRCQRILDEIMPQIISGTDREQRALACFTLARCTVATEGTGETALREAISYLNIAERDYDILEMYRHKADTQYLLAVLYDNLGMVRERDDIAERRHTTEQTRRLMEEATTSEEEHKIMHLVYKVGAALTAR